MLEDRMLDGLERYSPDALADDGAPISYTIYRKRERRYGIRPTQGRDFDFRDLRWPGSAAEPNQAAHAGPHAEEELEPVGLIERVRQRKIVQWLIGYLAMAAIIIQLIEALAGMWDISVPWQRCISLGLAFGTLPALVVAWYHGELGRQRVTASELGIVGLLLIGGVFTIWRVCWI